MIREFVGHIVKFPLSIVNNIYTRSYYGKGLRCPNVKVDDLRDENILIISPELDNATIGMGGTLFKYKEMESNKTLVAFMNVEAREDLARKKKTEAMEVFKEFNIDNIYFIEGEASEDEKVAKLIELIRVEEPSRIYTPFLFNGENSHLESTRILLKALEICDENFKNIWMYEVDTPNDLRLINRVVSLDRDIFKSKKKVYRHFKSNKNKGFDAFNIIDRRKSLLVASKSSYAAETFIRLGLKTAKEIDEMLLSTGFTTDEIKGVSSQMDLLSAFLQNKERKRVYNNNLNYILKGKFINSQGDE